MSLMRILHDSGNCIPLGHTDSYNAVQLPSADATPSSVYRRTQKVLDASYAQSCQVHLVEKFSVELLGALLAAELYNQSLESHHRPTRRGGICYGYSCVHHCRQDYKNP
jgi:hypothetical protein